MIMYVVYIWNIVDKVFIEFQIFKYIYQRVSFNLFILYIMKD